MDFFGTILWPLRWLIELILVVAHQVFTTLGLPADAGITWLLAILVLLVLVRLAALPLMVRSTRSSQQLILLNPQLEAIRARYKDQSDPAARAAFNTELMTLYRESNVNPLGSILPLLVQLPLFFGLYSVLRTAQLSKSGVGLLNQSLATSFGNSQLFGAPLHDSLFANQGNGTVVLLCLICILITGLTQFLAQQVTFKYNMTAEAQAKPFKPYQRVVIFAVPLIIALTGLAIQLGLLAYLALSSIWTLVQQLLLMRYIPMPTSPADRAKRARLAKRGKAV